MKPHLFACVISQDPREHWVVGQVVVRSAAESIEEHKVCIFETSATPLQGNPGTYIQNWTPVAVPNAWSSARVLSVARERCLKIWHPAIQQSH